MQTDSKHPVYVAAYAKYKADNMTDEGAHKWASEDAAQAIRDAAPAMYEALKACLDQMPKDVHSGLAGKVRAALALAEKGE